MRNGIIRKLGGHIAAPESADYCHAQSFHRKFVTLYAGYYKDHPYVKDREVNEWIHEELAHMLAGMLLKEDLIRFVEYPGAGETVRVEGYITVEDNRLANKTEEDKTDA